MQSLRTIWALIEGQRGQYLKAVAVLVLASCFMYLIPLVPQAILDGVLSTSPKQPSPIVQWMVGVMGGKAWLSGHLWMAALVIGALAAVAGWFTYQRGRLSADACESVIRRLRDRVYDHLQKLPLRYFDTAETGDLIQRCTSDVETLRTFLSTHVVEIGRALIMLLVPIPLMLAIDPYMTLASLALLPLIVGFSWFFFMKIREVFKATDEAEGKMTARIQENLSGIRVVRAFARQDFEREHFAIRNQTHRGLDYQLYVLMARFWCLSDLLCFLQLSLVIGTGLVLMSKGTIGIGAFYFFLAAVNLFLWPMRMMGRILADLGKALVAVERLMEILDASTEAAALPPVPVAVSTDDAALTPGSISFENVTFGYNETPAVAALDFSIAPGQTLGLVGPSGSGKSTILRLLLRLYEPTSGTIKLGGLPLLARSQQEIRREMAAVLQNPFLYSRNISDNMKMARPDASDEERDDAAGLARIHDSILSFEKGYETMCGERGVSLSGGQRQRVALARALLQAPSVLLLDDAMSAVDNETEQAILDGLRERHGAYTTVMAAHRLSSVMHADQILVLQAGRVIQRGDHASLLREGGWYHDLWIAQSETGEDEEEDERHMTKDAA